METFDNTPGFEWDPAKADSNFRKHGISFKEASEAFKDPWAITVYDEAHSADEDRLITIGMVRRRIVVLVVSTNRSSGIRLSTARRANPTEEAFYDNHIRSAETFA